MRQLRFLSALAHSLLLVGWIDGALAANVSFLNDTAMAALSDADRQMQREAALRVLESAAAQAAQEWTNPSTGSFGRCESRGNYKSDDGLHCRKLQLFAQAKGIESRFVFPVCKQASGEWLIASGKRLSKATQ